MGAAKKMVFHLQDYSEMHAIHTASRDVVEMPELRQTVVHLNFAGANDITQIEKSHSTEQYYNYFIGNDRSKWVSDVRGYGEALLHDLYDGIHLKLIEQSEQLKYEFHVQANIDPNQIRLEFFGQEEIRIDKKGNLVVLTELG